MAYYVGETSEIKESLKEKGYFLYPRQTLLGDGEPLYIVPQKDYCKSNDKAYQFVFLSNGMIGGRGVYSKVELRMALNEIEDVKKILAYDAVRGERMPLTRFL